MSVVYRAQVDGANRRRLVRSALTVAALTYVAILLLAPLGGIVAGVLSAGLGVVGETLALPDVRHALWLTAVITTITVAVTTICGVITARVLVRHRFKGKVVLNALVDLPFAVSPVTVGLMAVLLFGTGGVFEPFFASQGIQIMFALPAMVLVTIFICIPFVIREVMPVLEELGEDEEEAALTLGASPLRTFFKVTLPNIRWGLLYGVALSTARALGEIGAVLIVSGSVKGQTETATIFILTALEERQDAYGYVMALTLAAVSVLLLGAIELSKRRRERKVV
jgi:sulfate/thiosulfate transport system permease protein